LHNKKFEHPDVHITNTPFPGFPIPDFKGLKICSTAFPGIELLHVSKVVKLMGAIYDEDLTFKTSIMICNSKVPRKEKIRHAYEWNIPILSAEWLWDSIRRQQKAPFDKYLISIPQDILDVVRASREEKGKMRDQRTNHDRIDRDYKARMKGAGTSNNKHLYAESSKTRRPPVAAIVSGNENRNDINERGYRISIEHNTESKSTSASKSASNGTSASTSSEALVPTLPLQEISTNSPPKSHTLSPSPPKHSPHPQEQPRALSRESTAPTSQEYSPITNPQGPEANSRRKRTNLSAAISSLLSRSKSKSNPTTNNPNTNPPGPRRRSLFGRANSSSSSTKPTPTLAASGPVPSLSRTNSVSSLNSDGLGSVIPTQSQTPHPRTENTDATIDAAKQILQWQSHAGLPAHLRPDEPEDGGEGEGVVLTQLGYENASSADAKAKNGRKESRVKDMEGFVGLGGKRRGARKRDC
jgi:DNA replication regulator DPB11